MESNKPVIGVVTSRTCPTCGHHEIGYETETGEFHPLRPGEMIGAFPKTLAPGLMETGQSVSPQVGVKEQENSVETIPWVPDPLRCRQSLRCRYGVLKPAHVPDENMSPGLYEKIYREKLRKLIEAEIFTPVSVILDRYFSAPHLASGDARQVADAMWEELEEIRRPVEKVAEWLRNRDTESLEKMIHPLSIGELTEEAVSNEQLQQDLDQMTLEDFLEMV